MRVVDDFKDKGYVFGPLAEVHIITVGNKKGMSFDFYLKQNMHAIEWKLNAMVNKNKSLITKFPCNWRHSLNKKFESYRVR